MDPVFIAMQISSLLIGFSLHEAGHAYCAKYLGDDTSQRLGRLTLNPLKHLDPFGSVLLPLLLIAAGSPFIFAAAKPVPVNPRNFKRPVADFAIVALAGPMVNIFLAIGGALALRFFVEITPMISTFLLVFIWVNLVLAFFNLLPIPPLDGSKIISGILPRGIGVPFMQLERFGFIFLLGLILIGSFLPFSPIEEWIFLLKEGMDPILEMVSGFDVGLWIDYLVQRQVPIQAN